MKKLTAPDENLYESGDLEGEAVIDYSSGSIYNFLHCSRVTTLHSSARILQTYLTGYLNRFNGFESRNIENEVVIA